MALPANVTTGTWTLDNSHSEIGFTVRHAGISKRVAGAPPVSIVW